MGVKLRRAKFQPFIPRGTLSNLELSEGGVGKICVFNGKLAISRKRWQLRPRLLL